MAGEGVKARPEAGPARLGAGAIRAAGLWAAGLLLAAFLVWRVTVVLLAGAKAEDAAAERPVKNPPAGQNDGGKGSTATFINHDPQSGLMVVWIHAAKTVIRGNLCQMEGVELKRILGPGKGELLASADHGTYDRVAGSGTLEGKVLVRRFLPGRKEPDVTIRSDSLSWNQTAGVLSTPAPAELTWIDPASGRKVVAGGTGVVAESESQRVRLERDVRVSMTDRGLPDSLPVSKRRREPSGRGAPVVTVITCAGPAVFENETALGSKRIAFNREVRAVREDSRLTCDQLDVWLAPDRGRTGGTSAGLSAVEGAAAAPELAAGTTRFLARALAARVPASGEGGRPEGDNVDLVVARGAVTMTGRDGIGRGELAWYDRPAGIFWLDGGTREPAEVVRGGSQLVARSFYYDVRTEELSTVGESTGKVIVNEDKGKAGKKLSP